MKEVEFIHDKQRDDLRFHRDVAGNENDRAVFAERARERKRESGEQRGRERRKNHAPAERDRVLAALREIDLAGRYGVDLYDSQANFFWLRLGGRNVEFAQACEAIGVTVRPYAPDGVRVTIGEQEANDRVIELLRIRVLAELPCLVRSALHRVVTGG